MRALAVRPGTANSIALIDMPRPPSSGGPVLVDGLAIGLSGIDLEIIQTGAGEAPAGSELLVLGHENLGRVRDPGGTDLVEGDLVVGFARQPDPVPCPACAVGEWDMCRNGRYTERGVKGLHGFAREQWRSSADDLVVLDPALADVGVLMEPTTRVAKAWEQIERIGQRSYFDPHVVAVTGAGPIGLLAALLGRHRGFEVHVFDIVKDGPKPQLVADLGAIYHTTELADSDVVPDIVIECTGVPHVVVDATTHHAASGIVCLAGMASGGRDIPLDVDALNRLAVLENDVVFGTVNANRRHYVAAAAELAAADQTWLARVLNRRVPLTNYVEALTRHPDDIKVVLDLTA